jgi:hypothetical protein
MELATGGDLLSRCSFAPIREWDAMQILKYVPLPLFHSLRVCSQADNLGRYLGLFNICIPSVLVCPCPTLDLSL